MYHYRQLRIWHLIVFNIFFNFVAKFLARQMGFGIVGSYTLLSAAEILFFILVLSLLYPTARNRILPPWDKYGIQTLIGVLTGCLLYFSMIISKPW